MRYIIAVLDLHVRPDCYTAEDLDWFFKLLFENGVTHLRLFPFWEDRLLPYLKVNNQFDLTKHNLEYNKQLKLVVTKAHKHHIEIAFDLFDNCGTTKEWNPFWNNINDVHGIYEMKNRAIEFYLDWIARIMRICGPKRTWWGLGNELYYPAWQNPLLANEWGQKWVLPLSSFIIRNGNGKLFFSADLSPGGTANRIIGWLQEEGGYGRKNLTQIIHGVGLPEMWERLRDANILSASINYGMSDDGVGTGPDTMIPISKRGNCELPGIRCSANTFWRVKTALSMKNDLGNRFIAAEFLPREISMLNKRLRKLDIEKSIKIYPKLKRLFEE